MKSWVEISRASLQANVASIRAAAGERAEVLAVIKADAYGHGAELIAPVLAEAGVTWLGVADAQEGAGVRRALDAHQARNGETHFPAARILVMCGFETPDVDIILEHNLTPVFWTPAHLEALESAAELAGVRVAAHLELDSGMARQGTAPGEQLSHVLQALERARRVRMEGVFTHLSSSEVRNSGQTASQLENFERALDQIFSSSEEPPLPEWLHLANSSALDEGSTTDRMRRLSEEISATLLVRAGIAIYGYCLPLEDEDGDPQGPGELCTLEPVLTWKTRILSTREIEPGQTVGYGATFTADRPMRLALLPVGYSDGFRREASSGAGDGWVMIYGQAAPVIGRVSMNLTVVDVTEIAAAEEDAEVTLLGPGVSAADHARWCGTIPYEILCGIRADRRLV